MYLGLGLWALMMLAMVFTDGRGDPDVWVVEEDE